LADEATKRSVLQQAKNVAKVEDIRLQNTFICRDMTLLERNEDYELRTETRGVQTEKWQNPVDNQKRENSGSHSLETYKRVTGGVTAKFPCVHM